ncbi:aldo-keto reductase family 1 member B1-like isoform X2 [Hydractinia symbiolongicarpus]|uniref:aldo-keto reductase family 1 member B1-like isoform X2 n=1 Tax=Hydractinia symbiolongicarpus TaxID=13093 RepID=UPI00254AE402|nr:aldo-keto reductase family 1 member B1-like isoform X2 [Hydractinia symbiolongicarpus]
MQLVNDMAKPEMMLNNGCVMPPLGFGTWLVSSEDVHSIKWALNIGYRHIDCASEYENEPEIGKVLRETFSTESIKREDVFITSKLWIDDFCRVEDACKATLKNLQLKYLNLYLIHMPFEIDKNIKEVSLNDNVLAYDAKRIQEVWKCMEKLVDDGLVAAIGISNFTTKKVKDLLGSSPRIKPACNQVELHPYLPQNQLVELCKKEGIAVVAYSPLSNLGRPDDCREEGEPSLLSDAVIASIAKKHKATRAQILLGWHIKRGTGVLVRSISKERIKENFESLQINLDDEDMVKIGLITTRFRYNKQSWILKEGQTADKDFWDGEMLG